MPTYKPLISLSSRLDLIEQSLYQFVLNIFSKSEMAHIKKLIFVPIGLPGLGKSTLSRHLESTTNKFFHQGKHMINVDFKRINYDKMLTDLQKNYMNQHP